MPVVSSDKSIAAFELVVDGENGYIVSAGDAPSMGERIKSLLDDEELRRIGRNNLIKIHGWTIESMAAAHMRILSQISETEGPAD